MDDLLTMFINHLLTGMILQVGCTSSFTPPKNWNLKIMALKSKSALPGVGSFVGNFPVCLFVFAGVNGLLESPYLTAYPPGT